MNKIIMKHDKLLVSDLLKIGDIIIAENGEYLIEYDKSVSTNLVVRVLDNVCVNLFVINSFDNTNVRVKYVLGNNSSVNVNKFYHNANVNEQIVVDLEGKSSSINYKFSGINCGNNKYDMVINHKASNTQSNVFNHLIAMDNSKILFNVDSGVLKGCSGSSMNQDTRIITIGENNSVIKPNMYIDEYDVVAKHSSVVGKFREDDLFYIMSRGIDYNKAFKLLVKGYIFANIDRDMFMRAYIMDVINEYWR